MATPNPRELQKLLDQLTDIQKKIEDIGGKPVKVNFEGKTAADVAKEFGDVKTAIGNVQIGIRDASKLLDNLSDGSNEFYGLTKAIREEFTNMPDALNETRKSFRKIQGHAEKLTEISADILSFNVKDVEELRKKTDLEFQRVAAQSEGLDEQ